MAKQLVFTSVPNGLRPGARGFCTVAASRDMSPPLISKLESLSGYTHAFDPSGRDADRNPIAWSYLRVRVGGQTHRVLSRRSTAGSDYTGRSNTIAHHLVLDPDEGSGTTPDAILRQPGLFLDAWEGEPQYLDEVRLDGAPVRPRPCRTWQRAFGDAGYAGLLLRQCHASPRLPAYIIYPEGIDPLALLAEAAAIAPAAMDAWSLPFSTYYTGNLPDADCRLRLAPCGRRNRPGAQRLCAGGAGHGRAAADTA